MQAKVRFLIFAYSFPNAIIGHWDRPSCFKSRNRPIEGVLYFSAKRVYQDLGSPSGWLTIHQAKQNLFNERQGCYNS